jgi:hypothetical protein
VQYRSEQVLLQGMHETSLRSAGNLPVRTMSTTKISCPRCQSPLRDGDLCKEFSCPNCSERLRSNRTSLLVSLEILAALGGIPLIGWVAQSNNWYLVGAIVYWVILWWLYKVLLRVDVVRASE